MSWDLWNSCRRGWLWVYSFFIVVFLSLSAERALDQLGKFLRRKKQDAFFEALQKLKEELMLLGFISFLLTVFQSILSRICIPTHLASYMHPCKKQPSEIPTHEELLLTRNYRRGLLSTDSSVEICARKIRQWKNWEDSLWRDTPKKGIGIL
ncbi:hypothetical protein BT93_H1601 [Corymbia citriodora subsp. variegata]|nr:hypothetical protein BT93_H1601 [Corymbia citriodora subsp. variegata]